MAQDSGSDVQQTLKKYKKSNKFKGFFFRNFVGTYFLTLTVSNKNKLVFFLFFSTKNLNLFLGSDQMLNPHNCSKVLCSTWILGIQIIVFRVDPGRLIDSRHHHSIRSEILHRYKDFLLPGNPLRRKKVFSI